MSFIGKLKQRALVQWALAYGAAAWVLLQILALAADSYHWPDLVMHLAFAAVVLGLIVTLVLAWYHGERGEQKVTGTELLILALLFAIGGFLVWRFAVPHPPIVAAAEPAVTTSTAAAADEAIPAKSIAVLPFENMSTDQGNKYFADGMQDLILTKLADIGELKVISRTSTLQYGSHPKNLKKIGQELGVATLLEGSVQKAGDQVLINVQLIDARTDSHIWAQAYTRTLKNLFGVEGEVAEKIAAALKAKLSPAETRRLATSLSSDPTANDLFLRGEFFTAQADNTTDAVKYRRAIALYRQALDHDPSFALARARLSYAQSGVIWFSGAGSDTRELIADAEAQARQALAQQPNLAAAHLALGYVYYWDKQNYAVALKEFKGALNLRPNDVDALTAIGFVLRRQGKLDAAIDAMRQALELDPRNSFVAGNLAETLTVVRRYAEAARMVRHAQALDPDNAAARQLYSTILLMGSGDVGRALAAAQGDDHWSREWRGQLLVFQHKYREAVTLLKSVPDRPDNFSYKTGPKALQLADLYRLAGDNERARALYAQALPQSRARLSALAGNAMKLSFVWNHIAGAELGLGKTAAALTALAKSQTLIAQSGDRFFGPWAAQLSATRYAQAGHSDLAVPLLAEALAAPGGGEAYTPMLLKIDPAWDPIRNTPEFQALLNKYAQDKPQQQPTESGND